jgi:hypothetical protein
MNGKHTFYPKKIQARNKKKISNAVLSSSMQAVRNSGHLFLINIHQTFHNQRKHFHNEAPSMLQSG